MFSQTLNAIENLLAVFNVQPKIGMKKSLICLYHNVTLLVTSHGSIQHTVLFCKVQLILFGYFFIYTVMCMIPVPVMQFLNFF